jgi:predicted kinase
MKQSKKELVLMLGPIGSGKSTYVKNTLTDQDFYISQDEQGKKGHFQEFSGCVKVGISRIFVDRMNFNRQQREKYIKPAREAGYTITIIEMTTPRDVCFERVVNRKGHPTVEANNPELANKILDFYFKSHEAPTEDEYDSYIKV